MSSRTHGGPVYLDGLFKDFEGDRSKINLTGANFSGATLVGADFSYVDLSFANFTNNVLININFSNSTLESVDFKNTHIYKSNFVNINSTVFHPLINEATEFYNCYCKKDDRMFTYISASGKIYTSFPFEIDERTDENGEPIYPKNNPDYRYIKLKTK